MPCPCRHFKEVYKLLLTCNMSIPTAACPSLRNVARCLLFSRDNHPLRERMNHTQYIKDLQMKYGVDFTYTMPQMLRLILFLIQILIPGYSSFFDPDFIYQRQLIWKKGNADHLKISSVVVCVMYQQNRLSFARFKN